MTNAIANLEISNHAIVKLILYTFLYTVNGSFIIYAWYRLLLFWGQSDISYVDCYSAYAKTQIARYIPGNIFHIPSRHIASRNCGYGHKPLAGAAIYEIIGIISSSSMLALLASVFFNIKQRIVPYTTIVIMGVVSLALPMLIGVIPKYFPAIRDYNFPEKNKIDVLIGLSPSFISYCLFFTVLSGLFLCIVYSVCEYSDYTQMGLIFTGFLLAVIAGFLTPGAPGGLGVREAVIVFLLSDYLGQAVSLLAAFLFRIVTISGDFLLFLSPIVVTWFVKLKQRQRR